MLSDVTASFELIKPQRQTAASGREDYGLPAIPRGLAVAAPSIP